MNATNPNAYMLWLIEFTVQRSVAFMYLVEANSEFTTLSSQNLQCVQRSYSPHQEPQKTTKDTDINPLNIMRMPMVWKAA